MITYASKHIHLTNTHTHTYLPRPPIYPQQSTYTSTHTHPSIPTQKYQSTHTHIYLSHSPIYPHPPIHTYTCTHYPTLLPVSSHKHIIIPYFPLAFSPSLPYFLLLILIFYPRLRVYCILGCKVIYSPVGKEMIYLLQPDYDEKDIIS